MSESYRDAWEDYLRSLNKANFIKWDYVILTASNETQAEAFRTQIEDRQKKLRLPQTTKYVVLPDPFGKRVGSGGATFNVLRYLYEENHEQPFSGKRILVIHSGGDSKRVPQYSAIGKLFSPVPRVLPDGRASTLFDEFIIGMSGVPSRFKEGMLVLSGDVLLLFNPLQIDAQFEGGAAISIKEPVFTGKDHGVFLSDSKGNVKKFLHKQTEETLRAEGAVNKQDAVDLDTGAILLSVNLLNALFSLISNEGTFDKDKFDEFVNDKARVSFYGDFLYPLAEDVTLEDFYKEKPEGSDTPELMECRRRLWDALSPFSLKLLRLSPAKFIHFGTTRELRHLMTSEVSDYEFLDWKAHVLTNAVKDSDYAAYNSYVGRDATVCEQVYLEDSYILGKTVVGRGSIISNLKLRDVTIPAGKVFQGLPLLDGRFVVRVYGVMDNPKEGLWQQKIFPVCDTMEEALEWALWLCSKDDKRLEEYENTTRMSLMESYNLADVSQIITWQNELESRILCNIFFDELKSGAYFEDALKVFGEKGVTEEIFFMLLNDALECDFSMKIRIYYALYRYLKDNNKVYGKYGYDHPEDMCFGAIKDAVYHEALKSLKDAESYTIKENRVDVQLPVRVNFGGGWTDTPPYCLENGGVVVNAAISLKKILPIQICVKKIDEPVIELESQDIGVYGKITDINDIQDCHNPYDPFALHKAALIACGVIPLKASNESLREILERIGGGIYLSTQVVGIPKGSGLGTSSILAGACIKGLFKFFGLNKTDKEIYEAVLCMEQIMSTGGGWQDQVGGLSNGFKLIVTEPGMHQDIEVTYVSVPDEALSELQERFALIYTGQRRLARNLLRDVMGNYIGGRVESVSALRDMKKVAERMVFYLESGDIDAFAKLLDEHWGLSKQLDSGSTNNCIDQIFMACEDMIDARFIAGAGGGGFIMVILKKGITKGELEERLNAIFQDSGVEVWESEFV